MGGGQSNLNQFGPLHRARVFPPFKFKNRAVLPPEAAESLAGLQRGSQ